MATMNQTMVRLYREAEQPQMNEFMKGRRYKVIALPGVPKLPFHYKYFNREIVHPDRSTYSVDGYNKSIIRWGDLVIEDGIGCAIFHYKRWGIVDYVKRVTDGVYVGKFYRNDDFKGYFLLVREDEDGE